MTISEALEELKQALTINCYGEPVWMKYAHEDAFKAIDNFMNKVDLLAEVVTAYNILFSETIDELWANPADKVYATPTGIYEMNDYKRDLCEFIKAYWKTLEGYSKENG